MYLIPTEQWHLELFSAAIGEEPLEVEKVVGLTLVDQYRRPLAIGGAYIDRVVSGYGFWGSMIKRYPQIAIHAMRSIVRALREAELYELYAEADESIDRSREFIEYFKGKPVLDEDGNRLRGTQGDLYKFDLREFPV